METQYLQQVRCLDPVNGKEKRATVLVAAAKILAIDPDVDQIPSGAVTLIGENHLLAPGLVDIYSSAGEPGHEDRETLTELLQTAIAGGFTDIALLPTVVPALDNPQTLQWLEQKLQTLPEPRPRCHWWASATKANQGQQLTDWGELAEAQVIGFSDGGPILDWSLLPRALEYGAIWQKPLALVPLNVALRGQGVMRQGPLAIQLGLPPDPVMSEAAAIAGLLELLPAYGTPVHLMRLSTARGVELVQNAKAQGLNLTASVNWHHLLLSNQAIAQGLPPQHLPYDPNLRFDPPLGNETDRLALIAGVKTGVIDAIAVDHQAFTYEEKTQTFAETYPGAIGYELILPCLWHQLVESGQLSAQQLWQALHVRPRQCLGLSANHSRFLLFDPEQTWTVGRGECKTSAYNTPWWGQQLKGRVIAVG